MNRTVTPVLTLLAGAALAGAPNAQQVLSYLPNAGGSRFAEECVPSPACGGPGVVDYSMFPAPAMAVAGPLAGAVCLDDRSGVIYATNGVGVITRSRYPNLTCAGSGGVLPNLPIPGMVGVVTGMAVDPVSKRLFLTNGTTIFEFDPPAGMALVSSWPAAPLNFLTGLDYDIDRPGVLTAVSSAAEVALYTIGGGLVGVSPATYPWPGAEAIGVARDRTDPAFGRTLVLHRNGELYDHSTGALVRTRAAGRVGLTFLPAPLRLPSGRSCAGIVPDPKVSAFPLAGSVTFGLELCNLPPGTPFALLLLDVPAVPAPVLLPAGAVWFGAAPASLPVPVGGAPSVAVPLPLAGLPVPLGFDAQWAIPCPAAPTGFIFTDGLQVELAR
ncbi:MAG: hypothetical protein IPM29_07555 [Planctomycetes bacterium]|nr:hypothetical protein [Planctomycetota bacterium]